MKRNLRNFLLAAMLAAATPLLAPAARAQGMMPMMPMGHHADRMAEKLKLSPDQRAQWDAMVQKSKAQFEAMRKQHREMHEAMKAELAKPEPDLAALAARADAARDSGMAAHKELRDGWLKLYATMTPEQKGMVKKAIIWHMKRMRHMHERMMRMQHHHDGGWDHGDGGDRVGHQHGDGSSKDD